MHAPIKTAYKTFLLAVITVLMGLVSGGARADAPIYNATVNGTNYDFTYITGSFTDNSVLLQSQPWWNGSYTYDATLAATFASAVGNSLGQPNCFMGCWAPNFVSGYNVYNGVTNLYGAVAYQNSTPSAAFTGGVGSQSLSQSYAVATPVSSSGVAPEMNASLIPQVGLLLGCLFFLMGRKREVVESITA